MKTKLKIGKTDTRITLIIIPVIIALTVGFIMLTGKTVLELSKDRMVSKSEDFTKYMNTWTERIINEINIYKSALDKEGALNEHSFSILSTSCGPHDEYPYGMYWGDEFANFYDASGWDPGPEYIPASRNWYIEGLNHSKFQFGEPYIDMRTNRPCVSATVALNYEGVESVLAVDVYFDYAEELVERLSAQEFEKVFFVSYDTRMIIASSDIEENGSILEESSGSELERGISRLLDENFVGLIRLMCDEAYYVNITKIDGADWYFVTCIKEKSMLQSLYRVLIIILIVGLIGCVILILLASRASKELSAADKEAKTDPLTGIANRKGFFSRVTPALKNFPGQGVLVMIDVDNFKAVNDSLGHPEGDEFLKSFAKMLSGFFNRNGDLCARLGGDEFVVFVGRRLALDDISTMLGTFQRIFHEKYDEKYLEQHLSISIGAAFVKTEDSNFEKVYDDADKALYEAKKSGKDRYIIAQ